MNGKRGRPFQMWHVWAVRPDQHFWLVDQDLVRTEAQRIAASWQAGAEHRRVRNVQYQALPDGEGPAWVDGREQDGGHDE